MVGHAASTPAIIHVFQVPSLCSRNGKAIRKLAVDCFPSFAAFCASKRSQKQGVCVKIMNLNIKKAASHYSSQLLLAFFSIPVGAAIGTIDAMFGRILLWITDLRNLYFFPLILFLPLGGIVIAYCYLHFGGKSSKGMNLVFEVGHGEEEIIPLKLIPFVMCGTWITHIFGGSAGREGVAVQIGATVSHWFGRHIPIKNAPNIFLVVGMAAGLSGLFRTPIAAVFFAMEVLVAGELRYEALFPSLVASFTASQVSKSLGLEKFTFYLSDNISFQASTMIKLLVLGMVFGLVGGFFAWALKQMKQAISAKLPNPMIRIAVVGIILIPLFILLHRGRYCGLGTNLINASFAGDTIYAYDWLLKLAFTILTLAAGFQGGEVTPLFSIGSSMGVMLAGTMGLPVQFAAALGYVALFGGATNTLLAPVLIGAEVFGYAYLPYFFVVCSASYVFNLNKSIYGKQKCLLKL